MGFRTSSYTNSRSEQGPPRDETADWLLDEEDLELLTFSAPHSINAEAPIEGPLGPDVPVLWLLLPEEPINAGVEVEPSGEERPGVEPTSLPGV